MSRLLENAKTEAEGFLRDKMNEEAWDDIIKGMERNFYRDLFPKVPLDQEAFGSVEYPIDPELLKETAEAVERATLETLQRDITQACMDAAEPPRNNNTISTSKLSDLYISLDTLEDMKNWEANEESVSPAPVPATKPPSDEDFISYPSTDALFKALGIGEPTDDELSRFDWEGPGQHNRKTSKPGA
jgi:hypothetical protein